ncbi:MAG: aldo/keto reductase [Anaerolineales bacterium]
MTYLELQGIEVPKLGLGTWDLRGPVAVEAVKQALSLGYRHIDSAEMYRNESEIGQAIQESGIPREELFLVSKVWQDHLRADQVVAAARDSCARLHVDQIDLYLIHWPSQQVPIEETMAGMAQLVAEGIVRTVGVSNFSRAQWAQARRVAEVPVVCNQVKYNVRRRQDGLVEYASEHGLMLTAYTPLAKGRLAHDELLRRIASSHDVTPLQVALRWLIQQPQVTAIPKAASRDHMKENLGALSFQLAADEVAAIDAIAD